MSVLVSTLGVLEQTRSWLALSWASGSIATVVLDAWSHFSLLQLRVFVYNTARAGWSVVRGMGLVWVRDRPSHQRGVSAGIFGGGGHSIVDGVGLGGISDQFGGVVLRDITVGETLACLTGLDWIRLGGTGGTPSSSSSRNTVIGRFAGGCSGRARKRSAPAAAGGGCCCVPVALHLHLRHISVV